MKRSSSCLNLVELGNEATALEHLCEKINDLRAREPLMKKIKTQQEIGQDSDRVDAISFSSDGEDESIQDTTTFQRGDSKILERSKEEGEDFGIFVLFDSDLEE